MTAQAPLAAENNLAALPTAGEPCPMVDFVNLVSGKWAIPILYRLIMIDGPVRFSELQRAVAPIAQKELTRQLRLFEQRGLVTRQVFPEVPLRVEYRSPRWANRCGQRWTRWPSGCVGMCRS